MCKTSILKIFYPCLYNFYIVKVPIESGSSENFPDPTKKVRIRIRNPDNYTVRYRYPLYFCSIVNSSCTSLYLQVQAKYLLRVKFNYKS